MPLPTATPKPESEGDIEAELAEKRQQLELMADTAGIQDDTHSRLVRQLARLEGQVLHPLPPLSSPLAPFPPSACSHGQTLHSPTIRWCYKQLPPTTLHTTALHAFTWSKQVQIISHRIIPYRIISY